MPPRALTLPEGSYLPGAFLQPPEPTLACAPPSAPAPVRAGGAAAVKSGRKRFPLNNFTCCLTLFSKRFSSFDHSTCTLSVSSRYLALGEIYLPLGAAFPNNSTRQRALGRRTAAGRTRDSHPPWCPLPRHLGRRGRRGALCRLQLGPGARPDFKSGLLPLHSPLLGQSLLVSFPPLIDMLKFSGYPYPIRGQPLKTLGVWGPAPPGLRKRGVFYYA